MAKILFGAGVADARNAIGGHVFSKNRNGAYLRMKVSPSQPRSPKQLLVRAQFGGAAAAWGALTDAQRAGWIALASTNPSPDQFGNPQILTGMQFFMRVNRNLHTIGVTAILEDAPASTSVQALTSLTPTAAFTGSVLTIGFTPTPLDPAQHLVVVMTPPLSPGKSFFTPFLKLTFADPNDLTTSGLTVYSEWHTIFGALLPGQKIGVSAYVIADDTGSASTPAGASVIIGA
jgi:hypothetical protein